MKSLPTALPQCRIECRRSGRTVVWTPTGPPILDLLELAGGEPAYSCRYGSCHTCATRLVAGEVIHPREVTAPGKDQLLPCCAVPLSDRLVIDL